ncbi:hypothetical protein LX73_1212 [Fodinibius salinus]|uniref:Uncharacterized protein n=1 Tax=Fodinibius salinus TaxID=860790 RepID=A0A5D3YJ28_9BACT|nr:hypothetical protein [Fodinibius salinus]TYP93508.1 hypothetical protein LX73_1212 [Fodinibius salinus]
MCADNANTDFDPQTLKELDNKFDHQLNAIKGQKDVSAPSFFRWVQNVLLYLLGILAIVVAPFLLLVRTSVYGYSQFHLNGWLALVMSVLLTVLLLFGYALGVSLWYRQKFKIHRKIRYGILVLVTAYALYGLIYVSAENTKTKEAQRYYRQLHPILRISVATVTLADSDVVITDIQRRPEDYEQMGMDKNPESLHYPQSSGYVHAIDLRTKGRPEWKNWMLVISLRAMALQVSRHVGTADHLHVYLPLNY